jgi:FkbM family methyltransferase
VNYDRTALGSDVARSRKQALARSAAHIVVKMLGLNKPGLLATEIVQAIAPVARVDTAYGPLLLRSGHGRLAWRARTFFTEEPDTIRWLDSLKAADVLWDVGANVGLYALYAAKFCHCRVFAFEPESQNYALLLDNMALNDVGDRVEAACIALSDSEAFGHLAVPFITKGGAYNLFAASAAESDVPESVRAQRMFSKERPVRQLSFGCSIDGLIARRGFEPPTHLKIDVDGIEYKIIEGARQTLDNPRLRSVLIELNEKSPHDAEVPGILARHGFRLVNRRSVWDTKPDTTRKADMPAYNAIFER